MLELLLCGSSWMALCNSERSARSKSPYFFESTRKSAKLAEESAFEAAFFVTVRACELKQWRAETQIVFSDTLPEEPQSLCLAWPGILALLGFRRRRGYSLGSVSFFRKRINVHAGTSRSTGGWLDSSPEVARVVLSPPDHSPHSVQIPWFRTSGSNFRSNLHTWRHFEPRLLTSMAPDSGVAPKFS